LRNQEPGGRSKRVRWRRHPWRMLRLVPILAVTVVACASEVDIEQIYVEVNSHDYEARTDARRKLQELVDQKIVEPFDRGLQSPNAETRVQSILHLMAINTPESVEALLPELELSRRFKVFYHPIRLMPSPHPSDSRIMVAYIIRLNGGHPEALEILRNTYGKEEDAEAREGTVMAMGALHDPGAIPTLKKVLRDPEAAVMQAAMEGLTGMQAPDLYEDLVACVGDDDEGVRIRCAKRLSHFRGDKAAAGVLELLAQASSAALREALVGCLGGMGGDRAFEALLALLRSRDEDPGIQRKALESLQSMTGQNFEADPDKWQSWWGENKARLQFP